MQGTLEIDKFKSKQIMKVAFNIFALTLLSCFVSQVLGLQLILSTRDPHCVNVAPERTGAKITVTYTITGVNEDQISFKVSDRSS